jgi:hypothetical protein
VRPFELHHVAAAHPSFVATTPLSIVTQITRVVFILQIVNLCIPLERSVAEIGKVNTILWCFFQAGA